MNRFLGVTPWLGLLLALGCSGKSSSSVDDSGSGGSGASGGSAASSATGGAGGSSGSPSPGGAGGRSGSGGNGATGGASSGGSGATGEAGESGTSGNGGGATSGAGGSSGAGTAGNGTAGSGMAGASTGPDISGRWAMFWFEDPVAVWLQQHETTLGGTGCCAGLGSTSSECCGALTGTCENGHAAFTFDIENAGLTYGTNVTVSEDLTRMGGTFFVDAGSGAGGMLKVAWVPLPDPRINLGSALPPISDALRLRAGGYELRLISQFAGRFDFNDTFSLLLSDLGYLQSDFGPFWWGEMTWDEATQTLTCGPVPATDPSFATTVELVFQGAALTRVVATYPNDPPYMFSVTPPPL